MRATSEAQSNQRNKQKTSSFSLLPNGGFLTPQEKKQEHGNGNNNWMACETTKRDGSTGLPCHLSDADFNDALDKLAVLF